MLIRTPLYHSNPLRDAITNAYRMDETVCLNALLDWATFTDDQLSSIRAKADELVRNTQAFRKTEPKINSLLHQYDLSTQEGVALMCLAEALLRIPDKATMDLFISDKISTVSWKNHLAKDNSLFINATTWSLLLTGKIFSPTLKQERSLLNSLSQSISRLGAAVIRPLILKMMKLLGNQFVIGETIEDALKNALPLEQKGFLFSYDMLGEAARSGEEAKHYFKIYAHAIETIGEIAAKKGSPQKNPGVSVKLSALHPRYEMLQYERVIKEIPPLLLELALLAKKYNMNLTVDAEESDRLDMSLDIFETVFRDPALANWHGFGLAVQAYQKRAFYVIDWLANLAQSMGKKMMVRLVKGAYWDAEIKWAQQLGLRNYPVFTRKHATDVSYLASAKKLLSHNDLIFPQFGTHNAYSIAAILQMAGQDKQFEFQCLYGMGRSLYEQFMDPALGLPPVRMYAPVGSYQNLLGYLVRRLLENGANSSFINMLSREDVSLDKLNRDPVAYIRSVNATKHPKIPLPKDIYKDWENSQGIDFSDVYELATLEKIFIRTAKETVTATCIVNGKSLTQGQMVKIFSPNDKTELVGYAYEATADIIDDALKSARLGTRTFGRTAPHERAQMLRKAAQLLQNEMGELISLLTREAGRSVPDAVSEVREAIDFCRYYAYRAEKDLMPIKLPGPTGEENVLQLFPRGILACISPWNFPLAIFLGQISAALAAGNTVIAKPAEQTPLVGAKAIQILLSAGVPKEAIHLLIGPGDRIGNQLTKNPSLAGVVFTGSTDTARIIQRALADREGPIGLLIAETGGLNAMIMDSSALIEQSVIDVAQSAFNSAGQRCSALRVLFIQEEIASRFLTLLKGYMNELNVDTSTRLSTDVGPVIDPEAYEKLKQHLAYMQQKSAKIIAKAPLKNVGENFFAPCVIELSTLSDLKEEVFGPILHVIRFKTSELENVIESIIHTGYGLTLGIQSRINATCDYIASRMPVGNTYINRNMIGAVVGVQPFGGEGLSGTGPKAGGPHYLPRFCVERSRSTNIAAFGGNAQLISLLEED